MPDKFLRTYYFPKTKSLLRIFSVLLCLIGISTAAFADEDSPDMLIFRLQQRFDIWTPEANGSFSHGYIGDPKDVCQMQIDSLAKQKAPAALKFTISHDIPGLKAGEYSWATEGRKACDTIVAKLGREKYVDNFTRWAGLAKTEAEQKGGARDVQMFNNCIETYNQAVKAGVPPTEVIPEFKDTMGNIHSKWCAPYKAKLDAAGDAKMAPYKKVLKNDKLRIGFRDRDFITLLGGKQVTPENLAKINVWFEVAVQDKICPNGLKINQLHRYEFDSNQKLKKVKDTNFCGQPPQSAFR